MYPQMMQRYLAIRHSPPIVSATTDQPMSDDIHIYYSPILGRTLHRQKENRDELTADSAAFALQLFMRDYLWDGLL